MSKRKMLLVIFLLVLLMHCLSIQVEMTQIRNTTKIILVPLLMIHLLINRSLRVLGYLPLIALLFSWIGDILLLGDEPAFFLSGMIAFVMTHVCYSFTFLKIKQVTPKDRSYFVFPLLGLLLFGLLVFFYLKDDLGSYLLPILLYMVFISLMASLAIHTRTNVKIQTLSLYTFIPGALLFVLSDALLAVNMFKMQHIVIEVLVMLTYGLAQFFITRGFQKTAEFSE
ncbi:MAG: lysoplasmalogenase [Sediminibacterium sp. Gen4]|jgi:uncharacterized membrane protein YhhN|uniref:lysoplasmalogenase n=1 Tax=unclassified Sediminibacterium TaxID=2635961 RepID=UPI0015C00B13|nr:MULTISPECIES: lysoplasmalogenase [unclassified Sediminibacterium]MBW0160552.1 lysoplasmalogenase [Sediminibacterium sp.]MBW0163492.1 lysoplasmalogenase [Sediminibacterium sp.]NWK65782.1 lysoplasmalogenase [Sediminibacterium sp. Gen4]